MAKAHVLESAGARATIAWHVPIPAGNNQVGVSWQVALRDSEVAGGTVLPPGDGAGGTISLAEMTAINAGSIHEVVTSLEVPPDVDPNAFLDENHAAIVIETQQVLQDRLKYAGFTRA